MAKWFNRLRRKPSQPSTASTPPPQPSVAGMGVQPAQERPARTQEAAIARQRRARARDNGQPVPANQNPSLAGPVVPPPPPPGVGPQQIPQSAPPPQPSPEEMARMQAIAIRQQFIANNEVMAKQLGERLTAVLTSEPYPAVTMVYVLEMLKQTVIQQSREKIDAQQKQG